MSDVPTCARTGRLLGSGEAVEVRTRAGRIESVRPLAPEEADGPLPWIGPGLCDIQINGYGGHDFNAEDPPPDALGHVRALLAAAGVPRFCPTVVTGSPEAMEARLRALAEALREDPSLEGAVPCFHLEGPFIAPEDGPRGAHPAQHVTAASSQAFARLQRAAEGHIGIVTLAPEVPGALELIRELASQGIVVAIGHTNASPECIREAARAGARLSTHLGNGAAAQLPRNESFLWEQLANDDLWASFIPDGHHLPPSTLRAMLRAKGVERSILTSDAIFVAGMPAGEYVFGGQAVRKSEDGRVNLLETPYLAGSALALMDGVVNVMRFACVSLSDAWRMASLNPRRLLGLECLGVRVGGGDDLATLSPERLA